MKAAYTAKKNLDYASMENGVLHPNLEINRIAKIYVTIPPG